MQSVGPPKRSRVPLLVVHEAAPFRSRIRQASADNRDFSMPLGRPRGSFMAQRRVDGVSHLPVMLPCRDTSQQI